MKKKASDNFRIKDILVCTHLRKKPSFYWNADFTDYLSTRSSFKTRFEKVKIIPLPGYQYSLF